MKRSWSGVCVYARAQKVTPKVPKSHTDCGVWDSHVFVQHIFRDNIITLDYTFRFEIFGIGTN